MVDVGCFLLRIKAIIEIKNAPRSDTMWAASDIMASEFAIIPPISYTNKIEKQIKEAHISFFMLESNFQLDLGVYY